MHRTTLTLDDDVVAKLKAVIRRTGRSFRETVNEALRRGLVDKMASKIPPYAAPARNLELKPGFDFDCTGRLLEQLDELDHTGPR